MEDISETGLRKGFTTGTCAAAAARAAAVILFSYLLAGRRARKATLVPVTLPSGRVIEIKIKSAAIEGETASATVVKDAGDDPDATNGAEITAHLRVSAFNSGPMRVTIKGGLGVGVVTRPGLKIAIGKPAINPVPLKMIRAAVREAAAEMSVTASVVVTISVLSGEKIALKTMNGRLGIVGGISILGTSGIVEPMSLIAYRHSISLGVNVALSTGSECVVFSTGRSSEKVVERKLKLSEPSFVLTGDHMGYALKDTVGRKTLKRAVVAGQFGKFSKLAAGHFDTHCVDSGIDLDFIAALCKKRGAPGRAVDAVLKANTAREVFFIMKEAGLSIVIKDICSLVRKNAMKIARQGIVLKAMLVGYSGEVVCSC